MAKEANVSEKTYILTLKNGDIRKMTIPGDWKITFGNVIPYAGKDARNSEHRIALRIYGKSKEDLRAVMMDVVSFRQEGEIKLMEKQTKIQRQTMQKRTEKGDKDVVVEARVTQWINPDDEKDGTNDTPVEFLRIENHSEL